MSVIELHPRGTLPAPENPERPTLVDVFDGLGHALNHAKAIKLAILGDAYNPAGDMVDAGEALWCLIDHHIDMLKHLAVTTGKVLDQDRATADEEKDEEGG